MSAIGLAVGAMVVDALIGDPPALYRRLPHPVDLMARLLMGLEARWNRPLDDSRRRRLFGLLAMAVAVAATVAAALALQWLLFAMLPLILAVPLLMVLTSTLLAARGLVEHVRAVEMPLRQGEMVEARQALAKIVGRDTERLTPSQMVGAALESLAENFSDAVLAPLFWTALLGLPGLAAYKMINTADSLIGHRSDRFRDFGWAAARLDDGVNWIPARLSALVLALAGPRRAVTALRMAWWHGPAHASVNAGWPEAALAGSLDIRIGGPRDYGSAAVAGAFMGEGRESLTAQDLDLAIRLVKGAWLVALLVLLFAGLVSGFSV